MHNILLTGVATLDIINLLDSYPLEDSENRALQQIIRTGGNACNTAQVLRQSGFNTTLLAPLADDISAGFIQHQLKQRFIDTSLCPIQPDSATPTSYITLNRSNGSRTIVHYRQLEELQSAYFCTLSLSHFDWLHFEARNCLQLQQMLHYAKSSCKPISIELEKPRDHIDEILQYADVLLISRPFAESRHFTSATDCLDYFSRLYPCCIITCTWGDSGAWVYDKTEIIHQPAFSLSKTVETLGAGDTFNAGFICALIQQRSIKDALTSACGLAARKCQQTGFDSLSITD